MTEMKYFTDHQECPGINGIYYPDDSVQLLDVSMVNGEDGVRYSIGKGDKNQVSELKLEGDSDIWNDCAVISEKHFPVHGITVLAGESDYGDDGFVAVIDSCSSELIWLAFFDCSNPFSDASVDEKMNLIAISTRGFAWSFPLSSPGCVKVERS